MKLYERLSGLELNHPYLKALQNYEINKSLPRKPKKKKLARDTKEFYDIDGKIQQWGKFNDSWYEEVQAKTSKG